MNKNDIEKFPEFSLDPDKMGEFNNKGFADWANSLHEKQEPNPERDLKIIKATMLVNYGDNGKTIKGLVNEKQEPIHMIVDVLGHYHTKITKSTKKLNNDLCPVVIKSLPIQDVGSKIEKDCREHITTEGQRFYGVSWAEITRILQKYGYKNKIPF